MSHFSAKRIAGALIALPVIVMFWLLAAPPSLGGSLSYVITHGVSMEPSLHEDDLVIVKTASSYKVGDAVAYYNHELKTVVLHRIVDIDGGRFVFKGDNNDFLDSFHPSSADLIGKQLLVIGGGGKGLKPLSSAYGLSGAAAAAVALLLWSNLRGRKHSDEPGVLAWKPSSLLVAHRAMVFTVLIALLLTGGALYSAATRAASPRPIDDEISFSQQGTFDYKAQAKQSPAYSSTRVTGGQPLFLKLVDSAQVSFDYKVDTEADLAVGGTASLSAELYDSTSGWSRSLPLGAAEAFDGPSVLVSRMLDLRSIRHLLNEIETVTGVHRDVYELRVNAKVDVAGQVAGEDIDQRFSARLPFQLDAYQARVMKPADGHDTFTTSENGSVTVTDIRPGELRIANVPLQGPAKSVGGGLAILSALALLVLLLRRPNKDEVELINARYGAGIVPVRAGTSRGRRAIDVDSIEALVQLADSYEKVVLHEQIGTLHRYLVEQDGVFYRYEARGSRVGRPLEAAAVEPDELTELQLLDSYETA